ncbi:hypothetical protein GHT06_019107 [Daphnia sinensis]|uniref:RHD domain-containing protein n=1 Tax=Daphnia sinensis TaxID=1820382 RepID=A0AAD5L190_9CRUS|nr:hypothetical protein GHT06_019107 [Daphnia sinensis]
MQQPIGNNSPYSPESSHSSSSPLSHCYSSGNSPIMCASPNNVYLVTGSLPNSVAARTTRLSPCLSILNQPQSKFRFRYASEMTGTHGCLMAESKERNKKEYIRIQLEGCQEREAIIRCTLVTNSPKPVPHVHRLGGEGNSNGNEGEFQEIVVSASKNDWIATFSGLTIMHTAKKQVREVIERRLITEKGPINRNQGQQLKDEADKIANTMDLHSVRLKFEAFVERNGFREQIGVPVYSQAIHNLKSTHAGDLRLVRIDKVYSCCTGQEEIFIFVEKVNKKDIKIRFFETDENEQEQDPFSGSDEVKMFVKNLAKVIVNSTIKSLKRDIFVSTRKMPWWSKELCALHIYTEELVAITKAIECACVSSPPLVRISSDSRSVTEAVNGFNPSNDYIIHIRNIVADALSANQDRTTLDSNPRRNYRKRHR